MYTVKCFKPENKLALGYSFYVLNRGENSGRPSYSPNPNCFVVSTQTEEDRLILFYACQALHLNGRFRPHLIGSVIVLLRIGDFKDVLNKAYDSFSKKSEPISKAVERIDAAYSLIQLTEKKSKAIVKLHRCYLYESFIK
jgi:hypothetical protein